MGVAKYAKFRRGGKFVNYYLPALFFNAGEDLRYQIQLTEYPRNVGVF